MKAAFLDKLISRLDRIDPQSLQTYVLKLAREKGFLETLFNTIQEGIIVADSEGRIRYLNHAAGELLGLDVERAVGEPLSRHLRELDWERIWSADPAEWKRVISHELEVFYPRHRFLSFYIVPVLDEAKPLVNSLAIILRDVTEARQKVASTVESEKLSALTLLAAGVAHEIGNPLNSLNIHLQLMEREARSLSGQAGDRLRQDIRQAREEVARLDRIIHQFLHAIRPTKPDLQKTAINDVVRESLELVEREAADRDILVETELGNDLPAVLADRAQLKQAFYNIMRNALQAMRAGGILRVATEATESHVVVSFTDTGHGIRADHIGRIFEPYFTTKPDGSGLGLMIVQRVVREHGGTIEVESNTGRGTTFRIRLPVHERRMRLLAAPKELQT